MTRIPPQSSSSRPAADPSRSESTHGFGLRAAHYHQLLAEGVSVPWVEAVSENFMGRGGMPEAVLERVRADAQVLLHGVSLSIGATDPLSDDYLRSLRELVGRCEPAWVSDHLCWGTFVGHYGHDLWPLPFTEEAIDHVTDRVAQVQDALGRQILLENVSSYVSYSASEMSEWAFICELLARADCGLLLDVNNVFVSARNHGFDGREYIDALPPERIKQIHLAGHHDAGTHLLDDHGSEVVEGVWELYRHTIARIGPRPTIIEWDSNLPTLERLAEEAEKANAAAREAVL